MDYLRGAACREYWEFLRQLNEQGELGLSIREMLALRDAPICVPPHPSRISHMPEKCACKHASVGEQCQRCGHHCNANSTMGELTEAELNHLVPILASEHTKVGDREKGSKEPEKQGTPEDLDVPEEENSGQEFQVVHEQIEIKVVKECPLEVQLD